jgi:hypothetical protein|tara:strand:- start:28291 stop:29028 length:738 start_codon:yes stop_codon:yes gene_type:complete
MKEILEKLKDDNHYYGKFGQQYLSNSDIITLLNDPKSFRKPKEITKPMIIGRYFHTAILEPNKLSSTEFIGIDASSRNTKKYKEEILEHGRDIMMLQKEKDETDRAIASMNNNLEFYDAIYSEDNKFEVPAVHEVCGMMWKGKADIVGKDILIDLKTTGNIKDFKYSARKYNYDSQAYLYQQFFNKPMVFYVVDKMTLELGIYYPSETFLQYGKEKVEKAIEVFNKFYKEDAEEDIQNYIIKETL